MNNDQAGDQGPKKITLGILVGWVFGLLALLTGVMTLFSAPIAGLIFLAISAIALPPVMRQIEKKTNISLSRTLKFIIIIVLLFFAGMALPNSKSDETPITNDVTREEGVIQENTIEKEASESPAPTESPYDTFGDGMHVVSEDIQPGTYRTRSRSSGCYYARLGGFGGSLDEIISNNNTDAPAVVTIAASDKGFQSTRCGTWTTDLSAITDSKTSFADGIYLIGTDIEPGTYRNSGNSGCYFARLGGFSGNLDEIISNNNTDAPAVVTIAASDKGFQSTRCGTWEKTQ